MPAIKKGLVSMAKAQRPPSATKKVLAPVTPNWLQLSRDDKFTDHRPLWGEVRTKGWMPSSMGDPCDRKTILGMFGYRGDPISVKLRRIFDMGKAIEKIWQAEFESMGILLGKNVRFAHPNNPVISGEYDVMVRHPYEPGRRMIGEIKSINDNGFKKLPPVSLNSADNIVALMSVKDGYVGARFRKYMYQLQAYLYFVEGVEEGFLLFDNKNSQDYKLYPVSLDPDIIVPETQRLVRLEEYRPKLVVPACTCDAKKSGLCTIHPDEDIPLDELKNLVTEV